MTGRLARIAAMTGRVQLGRRAVFQDRRRAALAAGGVAAALLLVLMLQAYSTGRSSSSPATSGSHPAAVVVSEKNVRTMHTSASSLGPATPAVVRQLPGVAWAEGIRYTTTFLSPPTAGSS